MKILNRETSKKYDKYFDSIMMRMSFWNIQFRKIDENEKINGHPGWCESFNDKSIISIDVNLAQDEFDCALAHELGHITLKLKGFADTVVPQGCSDVTRAQRSGSEISSLLSDVVINEGLEKEGFTPKLLYDKLLPDEGRETELLISEFKKRGITDMACLYYLKIHFSCGRSIRRRVSQSLKKYAPELFEFCNEMVSEINKVGFENPIAYRKCLKLIIEKLGLGYYVEIKENVQVLN